MFRPVGSCGSCTFSHANNHNDDVGYTEYTFGYLQLPCVTFLEGSSEAETKRLGTRLLRAPATVPLPLCNCSLRPIPTCPTRTNATHASDLLTTS